MRLVASDMDGTIIDREGRISDRTVRAFRACRNAGVELVFVTGRPPRWLAPLQEQLDFNGTVICSNGAVTYRLSDHQVLEAALLPQESVFQTIRIIQQLYPDAAFAAETIKGFHIEPGFADRATLEQIGVTPGKLSDTLVAEAEAGANEAAQAGTAEPDPGGGVSKLLAKVPAISPDTFAAGVDAAVGHLVSVTHSSPGQALLEMALPEVNKAAALQRFAASHRIDANDVVAFGDMPNDIQMLNWAGHGYAMASGHPGAIAAADSQAPPFSDDGVAQVLEARLAALNETAPA
ncbi:HAD family hydrolase [Arthrobacter castelli]|uniref:HAD family hydrolase n=1 Tax=Arthrobacter castelli TaxID=271431 RepID=UPI0003FBABD4|nr:HAD family hydrolase [Arthrobacter castelli]